MLFDSGEYNTLYTYTIFGGNKKSFHLAPSTQYWNGITLSINNFNINNSFSFYIFPDILFIISKETQFN